MFSLQCRKLGSTAPHNILLYPAFTTSHTRSLCESSTPPNHTKEYKAITILNVAVQHHCSTTRMATLVYHHCTPQYDYTLNHPHVIAIGQDSALLHHNLTRYMARHHYTLPRYSATKLDKIVLCHDWISRLSTLPPHYNAVHHPSKLC